jgi:AraC-like DNA-binding protein
MFYNLNFDKNTIKGFTALGVNPEQMFREAGIPPRAVVHGKYSISREQYQKLTEVMNAQIKPELIIHISVADSLTTFIPEFFAGLVADCGETCLERISKYKKIIAPVVMSVKKEKNETYVNYKYNDGTPVPRNMVLNAQLSILSIVRKGTGREDLKPVKISMPDEYPGNAVEYIGIEPKKEKDNAIVFQNSDLLIPFITENNNMWEYMQGELDQRLSEMEQDESFSAIVRKTLFELIPSGVSDAESIADELAMSKRTLQRKLKEENTTYNEQLNHTRELLVRNYLQMNMTLDEIAFLVNYTDAKSLSRAFKTWTGLSVTQYKNKNV